MKRILLTIGALAVMASCGPPPPPDPCKSRTAGDLVFTEFFNDPEGLDTGKEYLELYNTTAAAIELKGLTVYTSKLDGTSLKTHVIRAGTVPSRGYFTLGDVRDGQVNPAHIGYSYGDALGALANSEGKLGLKCAAVVIDELEYQTAPKAGRARTLNGAVVPDASQNDLEANWCDAPTEFTPGLYGSPMSSNEPCAPVAGGGTCLDQGAPRPILNPSPGDLVISELMADPGAVPDTDGEWIEIHAKSDMDLNWLELSNGGTGKAVLNQPGCLRVPAGGYAVFARDADAGANGGLPPVVGTFGFGLTNSGGTVMLKFPDGGVLDQASWARATAGAASQLDPLLLDSTSNDSASNFCPASSIYGKGDKGTPGAANTTCPAVVNPDQCLDPQSGGIRGISRPGVGDLVITEFMSNPKSTDDAQGEWIEVLVKGECDLNGLSYGNEGASPATLSTSTCVTRAPGSYVLFAKSTDPLVNGGLPDTVVGTFSYSLANSGARAIVLKSGTTVIDEITYNSVPDAGAPAGGDGISSQLSSTKLDAVENDSSSSWCLTPLSRTYGNNPDGGVDRGTPGVENEPCL